MKRRLGSGRISPPAGFEPMTPWSEVGSAIKGYNIFQYIFGIQLCSVLAKELEVVKNAETDTFSLSLLCSVSI